MVHSFKGRGENPLGSVGRDARCEWGESWIPVSVSIPDARRYRSPQALDAGLPLLEGAVFQLGVWRVLYRGFGRAESEARNAKTAGPARVDFPACDVNLLGLVESPDVLVDIG